MAAGKHNVEATLGAKFQAGAPQIQPGEGVAGLRGDDYVASLLALPDLWTPLAERFDGQLYVAAPASDYVIFADARAKGNAAEMARFAGEIARAAKRPLSTDVFEWTPTGWEVVDLAQGAVSGGAGPPPAHLACERRSAKIILLSSYRRAPHGQSRQRANQRLDQRKGHPAQGDPRQAKMDRRNRADRRGDGRRRAAAAGAPMSRRRESTLSPPCCAAVSHPSAGQLTIEDMNEAVSAEARRRYLRSFDDRD